MRRMLLSLELTIVFLFVAVVVGAVLLRIQANRISHLANDNARLVHDGLQAHEALCVFKADLAIRLDAAMKFVRDHPHGLVGIPVSVMEQSIRGERATLGSLSLLDCTTPKGQP